MRIGILIKEFRSLRDFELRIIQEVLQNESLELALLVKDGSDIKSGKNKLKRFLKSKNKLGTLLFKLQIKIERKLFKFNSFENRENIIESLHSIPTIDVIPQRRGISFYFDETESSKIKEYNLDIILRQGFGIIKGDIFTAAKQGIWSFHHGDNAINRGGPPAFWEIVQKEPIVGVTLQQLTAELDGGIVIDKGFYRRHWSVLKNNRNICDQSVSILFRSIRRLQQGKLKLKKSPVYYNPLFRAPSFRVMSSYLFAFYKMFFKRIFQQVLAKYFGVRYQCWTLFIGKGSFMEATLHRLKAVEPPKSEFWADPFLIEKDNELYIFFENYSYKTKKGKISCGKVEGKKIVDVQDALVKDSHLSYPMVFEEDGELFMIPETLESKRLEVYRCTQFPAKWELYSTAFEGESIVDTTYYKDEQGQAWLFLNKGFEGDKTAELYIYKIASLKLDSIQEHQQNPVIIDCRVARGAGAIFKYEGQILRPSQNNSHGIYGYGLNINRIKTLNLEEYKEELVLTVEPNFKKELMSTHHLHQCNGHFVIDAAFNRK